ncbi:GntR family transcriptional regulator [Actinomycetospora rhizophila]|uniref:GntR family transcriptional regulator n=1 Tax=Actinomycetospora rhizophila TaxID=1416876 RepID=A0ABV9ZE36_9PSEU
MNRADTAYRQLRREILEGVLPPGTPLPEVESAERLGVSRTPVREALGRLAGESLVEVSPRRAARVARWRPEMQQEILDLRVVLESHAAELAAGTIGPDDLATLERLCEEGDAVVAAPAVDLVAFAENARVFHLALAAATGRPRLEAMVHGLLDVPAVAARYSAFRPGDFVRSAAHHHELVEALRAGNAPWAGHLMRAHILAAREAMRIPHRDSAGDGSASSGPGEPAG